MTTATARLPVPPAAPAQPKSAHSAPLPIPPPAGPRLGDRPIRKFTVDEYHRLIAAGFFVGDEKYELLDGYIVHKMTRGTIHDALVGRARRVLDQRLPQGWHVRVQCAATTADSEPEPDLAVVRGEELDYLGRHPGPADAALLVEIAHTSAGDDRAIKGPLYARAGFPAYWMVNVNHARIEVYADPSGADPAPAYRRREDFVAGQVIPLIIDGTAVAPIPVADLLPPAPVQPQP